MHPCSASTVCVQVLLAPDSSWPILVLAPDDIDEVQKSASVMPEGLTDLLTEQQLHDLIAFLIKRETDWTRSWDLR